jgi:hypothetical protein
MKIRIIAALGTIALLSGCAAQVTEAGYYWGNYANTLYAYAKTPSDETLAQHVTELEEIISESEERGLKVPPGVLAELGYIEAAKGDNEAALAHYEAEMQLYPESRVFLERLTATEE